MLDKVTRTIQKYDMAKKGESLLCCLSGGADSVALLLCMLALGFDVRACHINHQLRGEESLRDENFCVKLCERLGVPIDVRRVDVHTYCMEHGVSVEQGARQLRYEVFERCGCDKIMTAHSLSDRIETAVFNLARGTGLSGLCSIPPVRGNIIRPLIECTRLEIEEYLRSQGQDWVTDSTNLTDDYTRNRIRHNIVPLLKEINPSLEKTMYGTLDNLREDNRLIDNLADNFYRDACSGDGLDSRKLNEAEPALSGRAIRRLLAENGIDASRDTVLAIRALCASNGKLTVGKGLYAVVKNESLTIEREAKLLPDLELTADIGKELVFFNKSVTLIVENGCNVHKKITNYVADYDKIKGVIIIRNRRSGDKIRLAGRGFTSDVKKLLQSRFPPKQRRSAVLLADSEGVFFVESHGFAERVKADADTRSFLFCKIS